MNFMVNLLVFCGNIFNYRNHVYEHLKWNLVTIFLLHIVESAFIWFSFDYYELFMNVWGNLLIKCEIHEPYWMRAQQLRYHIISVSINRSSFDIMQYTFNEHSNIVFTRRTETQRQEKIIELKILIRMNWTLFHFVEPFNWPWVFRPLQLYYNRIEYLWVSIFTGLFEHLDVKSIRVTFIFSW